MDANFIQIVDPNEKPITYTLTVSHNDLDIPYIYLNTNQHDSSRTQPDADAPVKRSERGGLGENDADS